MLLSQTTTAPDRARRLGTPAHRSAPECAVLLCFVIKKSKKIQAMRKHWQKVK